jgi:ABC-type Fe3+-hydroxamate transport system substrate-binding protein
LQQRVVSLVPSVTESLLAWGVTPIACTRFCEQPDLVHVGGTKDPDIAAIAALAPDLVVLCEEENRREDAEALAAAGVATVTLAVESVSDVAPLMRLLATMVGHELVESEPATAAPATAEPPMQPPVTAFVPIWRRPWMTLSGRTYGSSLLELAGVVNVYADADARYPEVTLADAAARRPDVVLAPSEPYPFAARHVAELAEVAPVELVDGQDLFWWGVRTPVAIERLRARLAHLAPGAG